MSIFEIMMEAENSVILIEKSRAVLHEVENEFDSRIEPNTIEADYLVLNSDHIGILINVVDDLLRKTIPDLNTIVDMLLKKHKDGEDGKIN